MSMFEGSSSEKKTDSSPGRSLTWVDWVVRHPALVMLGTLVVATVLLAREPTRPPLEPDASGDEVPLFI